MPDVVLVLGPVVFRDFEIPSGVNFGGRQLLAVHQLTNGRKVIDCIGPSETDIAFSGAFAGQAATPRAMWLNALRMAGAELCLTWDVFFYTVVINRFDAEYDNPAWIPFRISCTVLRDETAASVPAVQSLSTSILGDLTSASGACSGLGIDFTGAQTAMADPNATSPGTAAYATAQLAIGEVQSSISAHLGSTESALLDAAQPADPSPGILAAQLVASANAAGQLASLSFAGAYAGHAGRDLSCAST